MQAHKSQITNTQKKKHMENGESNKREIGLQTSQLEPKNIQPQLMTNNLKQAVYQSQGIRFFKNERFE